MSQEETLELWWLHLDEVTRRRLLRQSVSDVLPDDVAQDLQMHGITVILIGVEDVGDGLVQRWWEQPPMLIDLLERERGRGPRA